MKSFEYINARSLKNAASILAKNGSRARVLAGGTDLLGQMKDHILPHYPEVIINIKNIPGLDYIRTNGNTLTIGALTRLEEIARNKIIKDKFTALAQAVQKTASPHIREMGTIGGNICQSNRCWYYWVPDNRFNCIRKGGKECYALTGDGRYSSILGAMKVADTPCTQACPANIDIPSYLEKIRDGNVIEAARFLLDFNPIPALTGRVCPHFCESDCNRGNYDESVSVRCIERFMGDYILENWDKLYRSPGNETGKHIAVIGSGPAGLSAAYYLRRCGHNVIIYEKMGEPGGLLTYGIPPYRLPKDIVKKQVKSIEHTGVQIMLGANVHNPDKFKDLMSNFDAVFIACGSWKEKSSGIKGEQTMLSGTEFLRNVNSGMAEIPGEKVAVIGGGNVALDVARSLLRLGARPAIIYRRTRAEMPALKEEINRAKQEGIIMEFLTAPVAAVKRNKSILLTCIKMKLGQPDDTGRPRPIPLKGSEFTVRYDAVIRATGEESDISFLPRQFINKLSNLKMDVPSYSLGKNVFAGGDFVIGPSTVVSAIAAGRNAAREINTYLTGDQINSSGKYDHCSKRALTFNSSYLKKTGRIKAPDLAVADRIKSIAVEEVGNTDLSAIKSEANRCFNCGCVAVNSSDLAPALIVLDAQIKTTKRIIPADSFFTVNKDKTTVLDDDEIVIAIEIPLPVSGTSSTFIKFALRQSIDFPVVNCAASITTGNYDIVEIARICLNSVYNQPYRAAKAEKYIPGKSIDETTAEEAAQSVLEDMFPLINNSYKIQIARTLVKRVILACAKH